MAQYVPARGDIVWIDFDPKAGHEQGGRRPALTISPATYNRKTGLGLFCPITSRKKGYPFEVPLSTDSPVQGVILADHVKSLDWQARNATRACEASTDALDNVLARIEAILDAAQ